VQGQEADAARKVVRQAKALQDAGAFALLPVCVPAELAREVTASLHVPTIGIGAGPDVGGQILVVNDMLGLNDAFTPKFVKKYGQLSDTIRSAVESYIEETKGGVFPDAAHSYGAGLKGDKSTRNR